ncbi:DUF4957 domain-containing protein [Flammeovirgaceae bacterium SG7u.111]|nr:DUF4957 domain-containing protein [Flammeovirgaceae bacterium SG7u.132]WPO34610.1 DUF4957 domain-containing protein [Flammeovirgaceae bacterium SG7u.111]
MKKKKINIYSIFLIVFSSFVVFISCKEDEEVFPRTRLFRPVLNEELFSEENTIIVNMGNMKEATSYTITVSRDTFQTVDYTFESDTNFVIIDESIVGEELLWYTIYQVQATAHADVADFDSKVSDLGNVRTQKFPSNMMAPTFFDVTDTRARVFWSTVGAPVTTVKVFAIDDLRLENPLAEFTVSDAERAAEEKIVSGLDPLSQYQLAIYSDEKVRGWEVYETKEGLDFGDKVVDLVGIDNPDILSDTLPSIESGSVVLLEGGRTYNANGHAFDKSVMIRSGYSFTPALPLIDCGSNFNIVEGSTIDSLVFIDVAFSGDFGGNYIFNIDKSGTVGEIKYEGCQIRSLRGIARIKGGVGTLGKFTINDCVVDSINGYGVLAVDKDSWEAGDISFTNSTFSKVIYFLISRSNTNSVLIDGCTISETPEKGRQIFRWRGSDGENDVVNGITIQNTIWGHGWNKDGEPDYAVAGFQGLANTNFNVINTYTTSDFSFSGSEIPGFPNFLYSGGAADLWESPYEGVDFNFKDQSFAGKGDSGDPRWRIGL